MCIPERQLIYPAQAPMRHLPTSFGKIILPGIMVCSVYGLEQTLLQRITCSLITAILVEEELLLSIMDQR